MAKKRKKQGDIGSTRVRKSEFIRNIVNILNDNPERTFNYKQIEIGRAHV